MKFGIVFRDLFLFNFPLFTTASIRGEWISISEAYTNSNYLLDKKRKLFPERSKLFLAEKFLRVDFLVPFSSFTFDLNPDMEILIETLSNM